MASWVWGNGNGPFCGKGESPNEIPLCTGSISTLSTQFVFHYTLHTILILGTEHGARARLKPWPKELRKPSAMVKNSIFWQNGRLLGLNIGTFLPEAKVELAKSIENWLR